MLAIITDEVRFYFDCATFLKRQEIPFITLPKGDEMPSTVTVVLTTDAEAPEIDFMCVVHHSNPRIAGKMAIAELLNRRTSHLAVLAFDPGPHPGFALVCDGVVVEAQRIDHLKDVHKVVEEVLEYIEADRFLVKVGHQDETNRNRIINSLWHLGITVEVVMEHKTTMRSKQPNVDAAIAISRLPGKELDWPPAVKPTLGELKEVQRQSRIKSNGKATISLEWARKVAKGESSMKEAIDETVGKE